MVYYSKIMLPWASHYPDETWDRIIAFLFPYQAQIRRKQRAVWYKVWMGLLLGEPLVLDDDDDGNPYVRWADSDDEDGDGVWSSDLNFINPFWKARVARQAQLRWDQCEVNSFDIIVSYLGPPLEMNPQGRRQRRRRRRLP